MRKLIIRTVVITFSAALVAAVLTFGVMTAVCPGLLASFNTEMGNKNLSVWYSKVQYGRTKSTDDLVALVYRANDARNYSVSAEYSAILVAGDGFADFSQEEKDYFFGRYAVALCVEGESAAVINEICAEYCNGIYSENNPFRYIAFALSMGEIKREAGFVPQIKAAVESFPSGELTVSDLQILDNYD